MSDYAPHPNFWFRKFILQQKSSWLQKGILYIRHIPLNVSEKKKKKMENRRNYTDTNYNMPVCVKFALKSFLQFSVKR